MLRGVYLLLLLFPESLVGSVDSMGLYLLEKLLDLFCVAPVISWRWNVSAFGIKS